MEPYSRRATSTSCRYRSCARTSSVYTATHRFSNSSRSRPSRTSGSLLRRTTLLGATGLGFVTIDHIVTPLGNASGPR
eukprot:31119-Pelagococcus_subviridis.AAC.7